MWLIDRAPVLVRGVRMTPGRSAATKNKPSGVDGDERGSVWAATNNVVASLLHGTAPAVPFNTQPSWLKTAPTPTSVVAPLISATATRDASMPRSVAAAAGTIGVCRARNPNSRACATKADRLFVTDDAISS